jgi:hypothetical protein
MKKILFTDCWVGCYVGEGCYEGGTCPDILITNVPEHIEENDLFDYYLLGLCGFFDYDKIHYKTKVLKRSLRTRTPIKITSSDELEDNNEEFIEVDFNDLINWIGGYFED